MHNTFRWLVTTIAAVSLAAAPATLAIAAPQGPPPSPPPSALPDPSLAAHALAAAPGPLDNPLKGFAHFYAPGSNQNVGYPHSLTWAYFGLSEVMNNPDDCTDIDWNLVESTLNETASYGNQTAMRFYLEYPGGSGTHPAVATPPCFAGSVPMRSYGSHWNTSSPDYNNAFLLSALETFIAAFGERYDGDPRIGYIHLGLVGLWGEWHTWPYDIDSADGLPNYMPTDTNGARIISAFDDAFNTTKLELRYPPAAGGVADGRDIGYHDDSFCYREGSPLAGVTLPTSLGGASYSHLNSLLDRGVENKWRTNSMGGEVRPEIQATAFNSWPGGSGAVDNMKACIELEHATWKINEGSKNYSSSDAGVGAAVRLMGYNLTVDNAYYRDTASGVTPVGVQISNTGVAPFYYDWDVTLGLKDANGALVRSWDANWDMRTIMPTQIRAFPEWGVGADPTYLDYGHPQYFQSNIDLSGLASAGYQLVMQVKNPLEDVSAAAKKFRFANATQGADGWLGLGPITVGTSTPPAGGSYEAEGAGNTRTGTAATAACAGCSGGSKVGYIGNGATLRFNGVTGGSSSFELHYLSAVSRTATVQVNGGAQTTVNFPATASWDTVGTVTVNVAIPTGSSNSVTIANASGWAPDIDRIVTGTPSPPATGAWYQAEASGNTLTGTAVTAACAACSGGSKVGYIGNGATLRFNGVTGGTTSLQVHYLSAESRTASVQVNGGVSTTVSFPASGGWDTVATVTVNVAIPSGTSNTVTIANVGGWAPDIDRIVTSG